MSVQENRPASRLTRRGALRVGGLAMAASLGAAPLERAAAQETDLNLDSNQDGLSADVITVFNTLPGTKALKPWAPPDAGRPAWEATLDPDRKLFIASAYKALVLAEYLLQVEEALDPADATPLAAQLTARLGEGLTLDEAVGGQRLRQKWVGGRAAEWSRAGGGALHGGRRICA